MGMSGRMKSNQVEYQRLLQVLSRMNKRQGFPQIRTYELSCLKRISRLDSWCQADNAIYNKSQHNGTSVLNQLALSSNTFRRWTTKFKAATYLVSAHQPEMEIMSVKMNQPPSEAVKEHKVTERYITEKTVCRFPSQQVSIRSSIVKLNHIIRSKWLSRKTLNIRLMNQYHISQTCRYILLVQAV